MTIKVLRLDRALRKIHTWDGETFNRSGNPVASCGLSLYPRSVTVLLTHSELAQKEICEFCNKPGRSRPVATKRKKKR